ncbi:transcription factor bHLH18-like [Abrus precatorius]|uniref:Transcription factor bHLH18-like n=1 Tax=Abrus precatorius TaxID=3816 RepID=A0A8B8M1C8_ABRPR|nr:transcription factor bHLH18-like [Abrus precatorius]
MTTTEESWTSWLCDWEAEDYNNFVNESDGNGVDVSFAFDDDIVPVTQEGNLQQSFSNNSNGFKTEHSSTMSISSGDDNGFDERPSKTLKTATSNSANTTNTDSSLSYILSFENVNPPPIFNIDSPLKPKRKAVHRRSIPSKEKEAIPNIQENKNPAVRSPHHAQDHIIAERKRRERISQQFIALSALIPGLKKVDKASVLGDAIRHVKHLQEQVKLLEEQNKWKSVESVVYVEKSKLSADEDVSDTSSNSGSGADGNSYGPSKTNGSLPEVEARVSGKNVLIRIHCHKQKQVLTNILQEMENLHLSVINSSVLLFGTSKLDITIVAQMEDELRLNVKELARTLRVGLLQDSSSIM